MNKILGSLWMCILVPSPCRKMQACLFQGVLDNCSREECNQPRIQRQTSTTRTCEEQWQQKSPHQNRGCRFSCMQRLLNALALHVVKRFCCRYQQQIRVAGGHKRGCSHMLQRASKARSTITLMTVCTGKRPHAEKCVLMLKRVTTLAAAKQIGRLTWSRRTRAATRRSHRCSRSSVHPSLPRDRGTRHTSRPSGHKRRKGTIQNWPQYATLQKTPGNVPIKLHKI